MRRSTIAAFAVVLVMFGAVIAVGGLGVAAAATDDGDLNETDDDNETDDNETDSNFGLTVSSFVSDLQDSMTDANERLDRPFGHVVANFVLANNPGNPPEHAGPPENATQGPPDHAGPP